MDKILNLHEAEDAGYVNDREQILRRAADEFVNADEVSEALKEEEFRRQFFDYTNNVPAEWKVLPVRRSDKLYFKKHTATQRPYYHGHEFYEFVYVYKGSCTLYPGIGAAAKRVFKGEAFLTSPGAVHALGRARRDDVIIKAVIPTAYAYVLGGCCENEGHSFFKVGAEAENCIYKAVEEAFAQRPRYECAVSDWLELAFIELSRENEVGKPEKDERTQAFLKAYLEKLSGEAALEEFAGYAGYSAGYVGRKVKQLTGKTFSELTETRRFEKAAKLLKETSLSVEAVAGAVGYKNASGIYKMFFKRLGTTPGRYREGITEK